MYLMTAHGGFLALDDDGALRQHSPSPADTRGLASVQIAEGPVVLPPELVDCVAELYPEGISFRVGGKYLCAEYGSARVIPNRDVRGPWETFIPLDEDKLGVFLTTSSGSPDREVERFVREVERRTRSRSPVKVYCGAGEIPRRGFLNLDVVVLAPEFRANNFDEYFIFPFADRGWGLPSDSVDYIFHEDFIEHVSQQQQIQFLAETLRVLKPGSWHRVNTPNLIASMKKNSDFTRGSDGVYRGELQWGHVAMFSPQSLKEMAELVGYREVVFTTKHHGVSPYATLDARPAGDRDDVLGNIYADLLK